MWWFTLVACERASVLIGFWELDLAAVDGVEQEDFGTLEVTATNGYEMLQRYVFEGGAFVPLDLPVHVTLASDAQTVADHGGEEKLILENAVYSIEDYDGSSCRLVGKDVAVPGYELYYKTNPHDPLPTGDVTYHLTR